MVAIARVIGALGLLACLGPCAYAAQGDWHDDAPGKLHRITTNDMPRPFDTHSAFNRPHIVPRPADVVLRAPPGVTVSLFTDKLDGPRLIRVAPNGDIFVAESEAGRIRVLRAGGDGSKPTEVSTFAEALDQPFGIAFYPPGRDPQFVYIADTNAVLRFPYRNGDVRARAKPETLVHDLWSSGGHWTRDVAFSLDGKRMFVSVGSGSNAAEGMAEKSAKAIADFEMTRGLGAAWDNEENRAAVLQFDPQGREQRILATGLRNCVTMPIQPATGTIYCVTNERDGLGDNLPPDYVTSVQPGAFYGWPWYYIGDHQDPRHAHERPDLAERITVPDVLIQPHSAPLQGVFYEGAMFPAWRDSLIVALHGSWNRATRTGGKIVRLVFVAGKPTGAYEDIVTGFVVSNTEVWGRPVGVAVDHEGAILISEDGNNTLWRLTRK
jgi:glucose/arabinose dehydrogenase